MRAWAEAASAPQAGRAGHVGKVERVAAREILRLELRPRRFSRQPRQRQPLNGSMPAAFHTEVAGVIDLVPLVNSAHHELIDDSSQPLAGCRYSQLQLGAIGARGGIRSAVNAVPTLGHVSERVPVSSSSRGH